MSIVLRLSPSGAPLQDVPGGEFSGFQLRMDEAVRLATPLVLTDEWQEVPTADGPLRAVIANPREGARLRGDGAIVVLRNSTGASNVTLEARIAARYNDLSIWNDWGGVGVNIGPIEGRPALVTARVIIPGRARANWPGAVGTITRVELSLQLRSLTSGGWTIPGTPTTSNPARLAIAELA